MINNITIGNLAATLATITAIIGGFTFLYAKLKSVIENVIRDLLSPVTKSIDALNARIDKVDMQACKNFLVRCLSDLERGDALGEVEKERFKEQYDYYINHDGNSYIKDKVEQYKAEGKL